MWWLISGLAVIGGMCVLGGVLMLGSAWLEDRRMARFRPPAS